MVCGFVRVPVSKKTYVSFQLEALMYTNSETMYERWLNFEVSMSWALLSHIHLLSQVQIPVCVLYIKVQLNCFVSPHFYSKVSVVVSPHLCGFTSQKNIHVHKRPKANLWENTSDFPSSSNHTLCALLQRSTPYKGLMRVEWKSTDKYTDETWVEVSE